MKSVLVIGAHFDDIELGTAGTCLRLVDEGHALHLVIICDINVPNRPLPDASRTRAFQENAKILGASTVTYLNYSSNNLRHCDQNEMIGRICDIIQKEKIDTIFTHNSTDINEDHQITSKVTRVCARPRITSSVNELYEYFIPGSTEWSFTDFTPTVAFDITKYYDKKINMLSKYITELRPEPDPFSITKLKGRHEYHGSIFGYDKAEVYKLIFRRN